MDATRVVIEVVAGLVPGSEEDPEHTRRWAIGTDEWSRYSTPDQQAEALAVLAGRAYGYAMLLTLQPDRLNWVRVNWVWL